VTVTASKYERRENEFYPTEQWAVESLIMTLKALGLWRDGGTIWESAAGSHALVQPFYHAGAKTVITSDIEEYGHKHTFFMDFIKDNAPPEPEDGEPQIELVDFDLITNPPYGHGNHLAKKFARRALDLCDGYVALLLTAKFDSGITRTDLFEDNKRFCAKLTLLERISFMGNGEGGTEDHAWYIWGPRNAEYVDPIIKYRRNHTKRLT